jgi:hypothetical protein
VTATRTEDPALISATITVSVIVCSQALDLGFVPVHTLSIAEMLEQAGKRSVPAISYQLPARQAPSAAKHC